MGPAPRERHGSCGSSIGATRGIGDGTSRASRRCRCAWVRRARLDDVMDLTPRGRNPAPGDDASTVPQCDRSALAAVEDPLLRADLDDTSVLAQHDALHRARAGDSIRRAHRHRLTAAVGVRQSTAAPQIGLPNRDDKRRRGAADGWQRRARGRGEQRSGQSVVTTLSRTSFIGRDEVRPVRGSASGLKRTPPVSSSPRGCDSASQMRWNCAATSGRSPPRIGTIP